MADNKKQMCDGIDNQFVAEIISRKRLNGFLERKPTGLIMLDEKRNTCSQEFHDRAVKQVCDIAIADQNRIKEFAHYIVHGVQKSPLVQVYEDNSYKWSSESIILFVIVCFGLIAGLRNVTNGFKTDEW